VVAEEPVAACTKEIVMPTQKDLKRLVRARMSRTGESYTAARFHLLKRKKDTIDYGDRAGISEASIRTRTGRGWAEWASLLDAIDASNKPHRDIAQYASSLGIPGWWSQAVAVGYERIRGLRDKGQRRGGSFEASKSRTFDVPVATLFEAFADSRRRRRWMRTPTTIRVAQPHKSMRLTWNDGTIVALYFMAKGQRSAVAVQHQKLPDRSAVDAARKGWGERLDRLGRLLS
jgi:hypothetical protein